MRIELLNSTEINRDTWDAITHGFNKSFDRSKTVEDFKTYYQNTALGYSFHALAYNEENILVGSTTIVPNYYIIDGKRQLLGLSGGSFVLKEFRSDIFVFYDLVMEIRKYCHSQGLKAFVGVSNKNSFKYAVKFLGANHIMDLRYFAMPMKLGNMLKSKNKSLQNFASTVFCKVMIYFNATISLLFDGKSKISPISIEFDESFKNRRFKSGYQVIDVAGFFVAYKLVIEEDIKTLYLMEYRKNGIRSYRALSHAIKAISKLEDFDLLLFIGTIHHFQLNLFGVPKSKEPKRLPLTCEYLDEKDEDLKTILMEPKNWDFSLVNFDVR
jgi:hypothetical protein